MNQEEIMQQLQAAMQAYQRKDLDSAEAIFKQILAGNPKEPNALHLLGCIYKDRGQLQQAVDFIQASIREDGTNPIPFLNLGKILAISGQHQNAAGVFHESLRRNQQIPEAWFCLGNALKQIEKIEEAKQAYRNALQLNPAHAGAASNLGDVLTDDGELEEAEQLFLKALEQAPNDVNLRINYGKLLAEKQDHTAAIVQYQIALPLAPQSPELHYNFANALQEEGEVGEAIASYRKAIEVKPDFAGAYFALGLVMEEEGEVEEAVDTFAEHYRLKPIAQSVSCVASSSSRSLNAESEVKVPEGAEFIPSYVSDAIPFGMHLMYVHIPKAGGIRFSNPIFECIQGMLLKGGWEKRPELASSAFGRERVLLMASPRIDSAPMRDGIMAAFSSYDLPSLDFSFLTPHGVSSRELSLAMRDQFDVQPIRLATWRDPWKRLKSVLDYVYRTSDGDLGLVREKIDQKDHFLDNAIYRGCFSDFTSQMLPDDRHDAQVDYLIDIGDFSVMNQIMSSFQSSCRLPNIVINKKVNVTSAHKKMDADIADSLMEQCVEAGFISLDGAPVIEQMVSRVLPAEFDLQVDPSSASLHPLTFVVSAATDVKTSLSNFLLPTEYLLTDEGQEFLRKTFS